MPGRGRRDDDRAAAGAWGLVTLAIEGILLLAFAIVAGVAALDRGFGTSSPFRLNEGHHAYVGAVLVLVGIVGGWVGFALQAVGVLLTVDDLGQHVVQTFGDEDYESPLHRWYGRYLWPMRWVRRITSWWDELFV